MKCLTDIGGGTYMQSSPQPTDYTTCTYLLVQPSELSNQLFNIDLDSWALLTYAIVGVWAVGFTVRSIIRTLNNESEIENE